MKYFKRPLAVLIHPPWTRLISDFNWGHITYNFYDVIFGLFRKNVKTPETHWPHFVANRRKKSCWFLGWSNCSRLLLKVRQFQNEFMKSSFLPKYERKIVKISALTKQGRNPDNFSFAFWEKRWLHKFILKLSDL